ncbi:MAG TPA: tRNA (adenosine(37)-N6)-threonylcarbamoyltransferase complex dimerization subunit type 1 TsaB [Lachnospiraceae bacterium]|nr:tRNA (adenosine(37)-N6)-threonylcarbamoyltransferase complex dimerization subunit type 1 TsaB [Lachnospiraceae bacterium]
MKILALDSSGIVASVAVVEDETLIAESIINYKKTHSQTLLPMLQTVKEMIDLDLESIDAIAITAGPGSFTGLRIGSATAKGLGLALNKPIIEVPTLAGLAYNLYGTNQLICPIMDARRNQVYAGIYAFDRIQETEQYGCYRLRVIKEQCAVDISWIEEKLNDLGKEVIFLGDGVPVFMQTIQETLKVPFGLAPAHCNRQRASAVAALAEIYFKEGKYVNARDHQPEYLRLSQAERERMERENEK